MCCGTNRSNPSGGSRDNGFTADTCLENGLCQNVWQTRDDNGTTVENVGYFRDQCTSTDWENGGCLNICTAETNPNDGGNSNTVTQVTPCNGLANATTWCCGNSTDCCGSTSAITIAQKLAQPTSSSASSSSSTTTSFRTSALTTTTTEPSPAATTSSIHSSTSSPSASASSGLSTSAKVGVGISIAVAATAALAALVFFIFIRRRNRNSADQQPLSNTKLGGSISGSEDWAAATAYSAKQPPPSPQELNPSGGVHEMASNEENMRYELAGVSSPALSPGGEGVMHIGGDQISWERDIPRVRSK
ncbi:uncharacterized protein BHQ10_006592 [Talaromyces amestolkiae]|uniref:Mid2 domain-containing protein n=1 Tax=Talaromyces amestolkiae TaxID=1196081 RepID=A0A364L441_TALAM|nr:uncharacterized protein BHQ10_006592 [Talaromyces amestolkiae]RAO70580.1 hypothetical protein BHQ10_006592 [Talaromyces amestolkiae]